MTESRLKSVTKTLVLGSRAVFKTSLERLLRGVYSQKVRSLQTCAYAHFMPRESGDPRFLGGLLDDLLHRLAE